MPVIDEDSRAFAIGIAVLMVVTGSLNTIAAKWADSIEVEGILFNHPFFQAGCMFLGELFCLAAYFIIFWVRKRYWVSRHTAGEYGAAFDLDDENTVEPQVPRFNPLIFLPPASCDVLGTSLMYVGLNLTTASSFQA
jgi:hypothetical protein